MGEKVKKRGRGRPRLVPEERDAKAVTDALRAGAFLETAVAFTRIGKTTFFEWMRQGARDDQEGKDTPHRRFYADVQQAVASAEVRLLAIVNQASSMQWQAAAWLLERRWPAKYGRRHVVETPHPSGGGSST